MKLVVRRGRGELHIKSWKTEKEVQKVISQEEGSSERQRIGLVSSRKASVLQQFMAKTQSSTIQLCKMIQPNSKACIRAAKGEEGEGKS